MNKYEKALDELYHRTRCEEERIVAQVRQELLIPYCNRTGLRFRGGSGSWSFDKWCRDGWRRVYSMYETPPRIPKALLWFMRTESILYRTDLGEGMENYTPPGWKEPT